MSEIKICAEDLPEVFAGFLEVFSENQVVGIALRFAGEKVYFQKKEWINAHNLFDIEPYKTIISIGDSQKLYQIAEIYGGQLIYFPVKESLIREAKNRQIRAEFNGYNTKRLAKKYNMSEEGIRYIIGSQEIKRKRAEPDKNQISIFDIY